MLQERRYHGFVHQLSYGYTSSQLVDPFSQFTQIAKVNKCVLKWSYNHISWLRVTTNNKAFSVEHKASPTLPFKSLKPKPRRSLLELMNGPASHKGFDIINQCLSGPIFQRHLLTNVQCHELTSKEIYSVKTVSGQRI